MTTNLIIFIYWEIKLILFFQKLHQFKRSERKNIGRSSWLLMMQCKNLSVKFGILNKTLSNSLPSSSISLCFISFHFPIRRRRRRCCHRFLLPSSTGCFDLFINSSLTLHVVPMSMQVRLCSLPCIILLCYSISCLQFLLLFFFFVFVLKKI